MVDVSIFRELAELPPFNPDLDSGHAPVRDAEPSAALKSALEAHAAATRQGRHLEWVVETGSESAAPENGTS